MRSLTVMTTTPASRWWRAGTAAASLAAARVRAKPTRGLVTGLGIAVAVASLFVTTASPIIAGDATLQRTLQDLSPGDRSITVAAPVNGQTPEQIQEADHRIRTGLKVRGVGGVRTEIEYRALAASDGTIFRLAGIDDLATAVTLRDGRLPTSCTPTRCEVVIAGPTESIALQPELGMVVVGHVALTNSSLLAGDFAPMSNEVILLGNGTDDVGSIKPFELIGRTIGWILPIDPGVIRVRDIDPILSAAASVANSFIDRGPKVSLPRTALLDARARAATASNRVALAAAQGVVLLAAFTLLAAAGARRHHRAARDLLRQRGAGRAAANVFTTCEAAWPVIIGLAVGVPLGVLATRQLADHWHFDAGDVVSTVIRDSADRVILGALVILVATAVVMATDSSASPSRQRSWWRPTALDAVGAAAFCMAALAVSRGSATASSLVSKGDPLIALLPLLAAVVVAWIAIRLVPVLVARFAQLLGHHAPLVRTALGEVARRPTVPLATAGFLAAATTLSIFSLGYRSTLAAGARDQASYAVPFDFTLAYGPALVRPSAVEPVGGWPSIAPSAVSTDILRRSASVESQKLSTDSIAMVGLEPSTLTSMRGWRSDFGPSIESMQAAITSKRDQPTAGTVIPLGTTRLTITGDGDLSTTEIAAIVASEKGLWHEDTTTLSKSDTNQLVVTLDPGDAGGRLIGFRLGQPGTQAQKTQHHAGEGNTGAAYFTATITLDSVEAETSSGTTTMAVPWSQLQSQGGAVTHDATGLSIELRLQGSSALLLPPAPPDIAVIPAIVDPYTAASAQGGNVVVDLPGDSRQVLRVAGIAKRFPGAGTRFAIVDISLAEPAFDRDQPGFGTANEIWIAADGADQRALATAFEQAPLKDLAVTRRTTIQERLSSDPLSRFTLGLFGIAAIIAALLAIGAVFLSTMSNAAEQAPLHRALAAEGVAPRSLSRMVRATSIAITVGALLFGALGSLELLRLVTRVIAVTATSTVPVPPLLIRVRAIDLGAALAALFVPCVVAAALAARSARRVARGDLLREFG